MTCIIRGDIVTMQEGGELRLHIRRFFIVYSIRFYDMLVDVQRRAKVKVRSNKQFFF